MERKLWMLNLMEEAPVINTRVAMIIRAETGKEAREVAWFQTKDQVWLDREKSFCSRVLPDGTNNKIILMGYIADED